MSLIDAARARVRALFRRRAADDELADEIAFHVAMETEKNVRLGMSAAEARRIALAHFGGVQRVREEHRDVRRVQLLEELVADARFAARSLARRPGLAAAIILTLALGLGANAAMFAVLDRIYFRMPSGVRAPTEISRLYSAPPSSAPAGAMTLDRFNYPQSVAVQAAVGDRARVVPYIAPGKFTVPDVSSDLFASYVGAGFFDLLGVRPALGRLFDADEERLTTSARVVVLSYDCWRNTFGADSTLIGRVLHVGTFNATVIGVAQPGFTGVDVDAADFWMPLAAFAGFRAAGSSPGGPAWYTERHTSFLNLLARPNPGVTPDLVASAATTGLRRDARESRWFDSVSTIVPGSIIAARGPRQSAQEVALSARLAGVALIVLLIACANVGNLLLARTVERRREIAVRLALGISRARLARMLLTESALLAMVAGLGAILTAQWSGGALRTLLLPSAHWSASMVDIRVVVFCAAAALLAAFGAGLAPALQATRTDINVGLNSAVPQHGGHRSPMRGMLIIAQSSLAAVLVIGAGLFVRSLHNVTSMRIGYDAERLVFVSASTKRGEPLDVANAAARALATQLAASPAVERVAVVSNPPFAGISVIGGLFRANGDSLARGGVAPWVTAASSEFFDAVGMRIVRGRAYAGQIGATPASEIVINETMARRYWPGQEPLGQCVRFTKPDAPCFTVVGIAEDARRMEIIEKPAAAYFVPAGSGPADMFGASWLIVRARPGLVPTVTRAARELVARRSPNADPRIIAMADVLAPQLRAWRLGAALFTAFGVLALIIAAVGVYSMLSYAVVQRLHEIGVRIALGARSADIMRIVVSFGVAVVATGVVIGLGIALVLGRFVSALLYGVSSRDPATMAGAALVLLATACIAAAVPAWRAVHIDAVRALRASD